MNFAWVFAKVTSNARRQSDPASVVAPITSPSLMPKPLSTLIDHARTVSESRRVLRTWLDGLNSRIDSSFDVRCQSSPT
eukprot:scaffold3625_cov154-Pinguiococcus_pyrenoidosus.AAC.1